ncbi:MAG: hypothetical protein IJO90_03760 [Alistipes sp.]|nr:hypothetical protein [Alistipes sp.]
MKRYVIIAVAALLSLTACTIESGYRPDQNQAYYLIHSQFNTHLDEAKTYANYAIVAQTLLGGSATDFAYVKSALLGGREAVAEQGRVVFSYNNKNYCIITTGDKMLSEGGQWTLEQVASDGQLSLVASFTGVEGKSHEFNCVYMGRRGLSLTTTHKYIVSPAPSRAVYVDMWGSGQIVVADEYSIDFTISSDNPLRYDDYYMWGYISGEIAVLYKDFVEGSTRDFSVVYDNQKREYK